MGKKEKRTTRKNEYRPEPEVPETPTRRTFTAAYKLRILEEADRSEQYGGIGELLRQEGLYSSHLTTWRRQRKAGQLQALGSQKRGPRKDEQAAELAALRRENEQLRSRLAQAELIIAAQKKLSQALETVIEPENEN